MKTKTKKLFLSLFAFAGLALAACSGGNGGGSTDSGSSSGGGSSQGSDSSERQSSSEDDSSEDDSSDDSSEEEVLTHTARLTSGTISEYNVVLVHVWGSNGADTVTGTVANSIVTFTLDSTEFTNFIVCELKPGETELGEDWVNVAKQSRGLAISDDQVDFTWKPLADDDYHLWGTTDGTNWDELGKFTSNAGVYSTTVNLVAGTEFVFHLEAYTTEDSGWRNFVDLEGTGVSGNFEAKGGTGTDQNNIKVLTTGSYTFTVTNLHKVQVGDAQPISSTHVLHIKRGTADTPVNLVANPGNEGEVMKTDVELQAGDSLYIDMGNDDWRHYEDLVISSGAGIFFEEDTGDNGNFRVIAGKGGSYDFYVNLNKGSGNSVFVSKDRDGTETTTTYPAALGTSFGGEHVVYVHAWGTFGSETYALTNLAQLPIKSDVSQFVLVSFDAGTTEFDWAHKRTQTTDVTPEAIATATFTIDEVGDAETKTTWHWAGGTVTHVNYLDLYRGTDNTKTELVAKDATEYKLLVVELQVGDVFSFCVNVGGEDNWAKYANIKTESPVLENFKSHVAEDASNGNIEVKTAGTYSFYVMKQSTAENAKTIYIANGVDRTGWKGILNTTDKVVYASTTNDNEIYIQNVELAVGDKIIFKNTAKSLEQGYAQIKDDCPGAASFSAGSSNELTVKTGEAGTYDFYIDLSVTKGIWVVKHVPTVHKTVNISGPDWLYQADPDFFAHVWDGSSHYVDVLLTKTSDGVYDLAFAESWTPTNIKVYRCKPGASAPHFDGGDTEGKVWNQSNEVAWAASMSVTFA